MHIHMEIQSFRIRLKAYKNLKKKFRKKLKIIFIILTKIMSSIFHQISIFCNNINRRKILVVLVRSNIFTCSLWVFQIKLKWKGKLLWDESACFLLHNKLNLGEMFDTAGRKTPSTFSSDERWTKGEKYKKKDK